MPALVEARRLPGMSVFVNRTELLVHLVNAWSSRECLAHLEADYGGLRQLIEEQEDDNCEWLAGISKLAEVYHRIATPDGTSSQRLVYRRLFLHSEFDPIVPPALLETLPLGRERFKNKALQHGVLYMESGNLRPLDLPWEDAPQSLVERAAAAFQDDENHVVWRRIDISKLAGEWLYLVPAKRLAVQALEEAREGQASIKRLKRHLEFVESDLKNLKGDVKRLKSMISNSCQR